MCIIGMYIAACGLDKTIRIVDFFSGEVICSSNGHSDMIASIKFSPDGQSVISTGSDGCIFIWKLPETVVSNMRERLQEIHSDICNRQQSSVGSLTTSTEESVSASSCIDSSSSVDVNIKDTDPQSVEQSKYNQVLTKPTFSSSVQPPIAITTSVVDLAVVGSSLGSRRLTSPTKKPRTVDTTQDRPRQQQKQHSSQTVSVAKAPVSIWGSHSVDGYELFGHKITPVVTQSSNLNKFTLERTDVPLEENEEETDEQKNDIAIILSAGIDNTSIENHSSAPLQVSVDNNNNNDDDDDDGSDGDENLFSELSQVNDPTFDYEQLSGYCVDESENTDEHRTLSYTSSESKLEVLVSQL